MIHRLSAPVLGVPIDAVSREDALARIAVWANQRESRTVCFCNAHALVSAGRDRLLAQALRGADMALADGAPVAWMLRLTGHPGQPRLAGPDLMLQVLAQAQDNEQSVFLLGSTKATLQALRQRLARRFPRLQVAGTLSPPFRPLSDEENARIVQHLQRSGAQIVFVAFGCPKQELWMARHRERVPAVMLGVGAAFDFHAGTLRRAPRWMRRAGFEWLHRLLSEPRRLAWRYLDTNTVFMLRAAWQLLLHPLRRRPASALRERA